MDILLLLSGIRAMGHMGCGMWMRYHLRRIQAPLFSCSPRRLCLSPCEGDAGRDLIAQGDMVFINKYVNAIGAAFLFLTSSLLTRIQCFFALLLRHDIKYLAMCFAYAVVIAVAIHSHSKR